MERSAVIGVLVDGVLRGGLTATGAAQLLSFRVRPELADRGGRNPNVYSMFLARTCVLGRLRVVRPLPSLSSWT